MNRMISCSGIEKEHIQECSSIIVVDFQAVVLVIRSVEWAVLCSYEFPEVL